MAGIYIHIPFCRQACHYCNFHFSTNLSLQRKVIDSIIKEAINFKSYLNFKNIQTIYFGGGTPSLLTSAELSTLLKTIYENFNVVENPEITLEVNPDDCTANNLKEFRAIGFNRLSMGIQSFNSEFLTYLNRVHDSSQAINSVHWAHQAGFENISLDLIYGIPYGNHSVWLKDLEMATSFQVPHISSYCLTIEPETVFGRWEKKGKIKKAEDHFSAEQFELLHSHLSDNHIFQYEISNFAAIGFESKHNSNYWNAETYLGLGPGAHSYNGPSRRANINNNAKYIQAIETDLPHYHEEILTNEDQANEYMMTSIRTKWGCNIEKLLSYSCIEKGALMSKIDHLVKEKIAIQENGNLILTLKGKLLADEVTTHLFTSS